ncbi:MAG: hypothetical protein ACFFC7_15770 [Candidatus Hermodarchaeota archaeon]
MKKVEVIIEDIGEFSFKANSWSEIKKELLRIAENAEKNYLDLFEITKDIEVKDKPTIRELGISIENIGQFSLKANSWLEVGKELLRITENAEKNYLDFFEGEVTKELAVMIKDLGKFKVTASSWLGIRKELLRIAENAEKNYLDFFRD